MRVDAAVLWAVAIAVVLLPVALLAAFNGRNVADSRGRRVDSRWRVQRHDGLG